MSSSYETVERIRNSHRHARPNPAENPAWANCHMDCGLLLAEVERLAAELKNAHVERDRLRATLKEIGWDAGTDGRTAGRMRITARRALSEPSTDG